MAKTQTIEVPDELKNLYNASIERSDPFVFGTAQGHKSLPPDSRKKILREQSLFRFLSPIWRALTTEQKQVWKDAAIYNNISGWQLFISDNAARIRTSLPLDVPPSDLWQVRAGYLTIESPATELILKQEHPQSYWVAQKVVGAPWKKTLVQITEVFGFPLELAIRYKSDLTAVGGTQIARYYARVWSSYQGVDRYTDCVIDFDPDTDWVLGEAEISNVVGHVIGYTLYLEIVGYTGTLLFDNIRAIHGGSNWALDPRCDAINQTFSKAFAIVPPFWVPTSLPSGSSFSSQFPPAL
jgi:hypothetical protein